MPRIIVKNLDTGKTDHDVFLDKGQTFSLEPGYNIEKHATDLENGTETYFVRKKK